MSQFVLLEPPANVVIIVHNGIVKTEYLSKEDLSNQWRNTGNKSGQNPLRLAETIAFKARLKTGVFEHETADALAESRDYAYSL